MHSTLSSKKFSDDKNKQKRTTLTLIEKVEILDSVKDIKNVSSAAKNVGLNESSLRLLIKNEEKIRNSIAESCPLAAARVSKTRHKNIIKMEKGLIIWFDDCMLKKFPISSAIIRQKAIKIFEAIQKEDEEAGKLENVLFTASSGCFFRFKNRFSLRNLKISGEQASADEKSAEDFKKKVLEKIRDKEYFPDQIFNADETALFWKKLPNRTYVNTTDKKAIGFKSSKERITFHLCTNLSGSKVIKPMIINKTLKPHAFKHINMSAYPIFWRANNKAWMTRILFKDWMENCFIPEVKIFLQKKNLSLKLF